MPTRREWNWWVDGVNEISSKIKLIFTTFELDTTLGSVTLYHSKAFSISCWRCFLHKLLFYFGYPNYKHIIALWQLRYRRIMENWKIFQSSLASYGQARLYHTVFAQGFATTNVATDYSFTVNHGFSFILLNRLESWDCRVLTRLALAQSEIELKTFWLRIPMTELR